MPPSLVETPLYLAALGGGDLLVFPLQELIDEGLPVLDTMLSSSIKVRESHEASRPLVHFAPSHKLTEEFVALFDELEKRRKAVRRKG